MRARSSEASQVKIRQLLAAKACKSSARERRRHAFPTPHEGLQRVLGDDGFCATRLLPSARATGVSSLAGRRRRPVRVLVARRAPFLAARPRLDRRGGNRAHREGWGRRRCDDAAARGLPARSAPGGPRRQYGRHLEEAPLRRPRPPGDGPAAPSRVARSPRSSRASRAPSRTPGARSARRPALRGRGVSRELRAKPAVPPLDRRLTPNFRPAAVLARAAAPRRVIVDAATAHYHLLRPRLAGHSFVSPPPPLHSPEPYRLSQYVLTLSTDRPDRSGRSDPVTPYPPCYVYIWCIHQKDLTCLEFGRRRRRERPTADSLG